MPPSQMEPLLPSNKFKVVLLALLVPVGLGASHIFIEPGRHQADLSYHQSKWNEYGPEIDRAAAVNDTLTPLTLGQVYGGVAPHHIPTAIPRLVEFYQRLKEDRAIKNFIVIGPDHVEAGMGTISASAANFYTAYGVVKPIENLASTLQTEGLAQIDEAPFASEHSVGSQILIINKIFPEARVTPIIVRSDVSAEQAEALGERLAEVIDDETVLIASVDFSHYLPTRQALPLDQVSGAVVENLDLTSLGLVEADSPHSLTVFMSAMKAKKATDVAGLSILNTNDLMENSDYTTGYLFGYWGVN